MSSWFKGGSNGKRRLGIAAASSALFLAGTSLLLWFAGRPWHALDHKLLDRFQRRIVAKGLGPEPAFGPGIVYLTITDETYDHFGKNYLDRADLARVNRGLARLSPRAVAYDIIFARPSTPDSDRAFAESIRDLGTVYLPVGCALSDTPVRFRWRPGPAHDRLRSDHLGSPAERGEARPFHAVRALTQWDPFAAAAFGSGDISVRADPDGVYRHVPMVVKVDQRYLPTLGLSIFLDWAGVSLDQATVAWGEAITVPPSPDGPLEREAVIPIDRRGRSCVPFPDRMGEDFPEVAVHTFLDAAGDESLRGNLLDLFEGNFVLIADVASGTADLGATPLQRAVPLVALHAALLNGLLTDSFPAHWPMGRTLGLLWAVGVLLTAAAGFRSSWPLLAAGVAVPVALTALTGFEMVRLHLLPLATAGSAALLLFLLLVIVRETVGARERAFIRNAFARYVAPAVVDELLARPEALKLSGEARVITILFTDLADFTTVSERTDPEVLVALLNECFTEMTEIVLGEGGIIDKYQGDGILAEFGLPLDLPDHADRAVAAGLRIQERMARLRDEWSGRNLPALHCRVGINTGSVIAGNMGSDRVLDYTVAGDAVNLASRLEGANKRYGTELMISEATLRSLSPGKFRTRVLDVVRVKGKSEAVRVHEVYGWEGDGVEQSGERYFETYASAFEAYLARNFEAALRGFREALSLKPEDPAAGEMIGRIESIDPDDLPPDWDGSITLSTK